MSSQPLQGQQPVLEGELGGPDYGAQRAVETTAGGMLNGTGPGLQQSVQESGSQGVSVGGVLRSSLSGTTIQAEVEATQREGATGLGATTYGSVGQVSEGNLASSQSNGGAVQAAQTQQPVQAAQPQQPVQAAQPQQLSPAAQPQQLASAAQSQQSVQAAQSQQPAPVAQPQQPLQAALQQQQMPLTTSRLQPQQNPVPQPYLLQTTSTQGSEALTSSQRTRLEPELAQQQASRPALRLASPRRPRDLPQEPLLPQPETASFVTGNVQSTSPGPLLSDESFHSIGSYETAQGNVRGSWWNFGSVFQRRVVDPMMSMGRTVTNGMSSVAPQASQAALFSPDPFHLRVP